MSGADEFVAQPIPIRPQLAEAEMNNRNPIDIHVGGRVRSHRISREINVADLASIIDVTTDEMRKYEAGEERIPAERLQRIAAALEIEIASLFDGAPKEPAAMPFIGARK